MTRSRSFSIYLMKPNFNETNSLKTDNKLKVASSNKSIPGLSKLYILDTTPTDPWWKLYFGIPDALKQAHKAAIAFITVDGKVFALTFGHAYHNLLDESYEYDFGLRVTLNCVDPDKIKNTDVIDPQSARRQRTQVSIDSDLTFFDFDRDSSVLRSLTGKVKAEHEDWFRSATGSSSLKVNSPLEAGKLVDLLKKLLALYQSDAFKKSFPDIQNIAPIKDPDILEELNAQLVAAVKSKAEKLMLAVPELVDYGAGKFCQFDGAGTSLMYEDVNLESFYDYLAQNGHALTSITFEGLRKKFHINLVESEDAKPDRYSIARSLIFETTLSSDPTAAYHYIDNSWYRVDKAFLAELTKYLDDRFSDLQLPACSDHIEADYNKSVATDADYICLDTADISPRTQTQVEPCDLYTVRDGRGVLIHVKIYKDATGLSHLFNQGANAVELLLSEPNSLTKLQTLLNDRAASEKRQSFLDSSADDQFSVMYAIITKNDPAKKSLNLPLFSKISLRRNLRALHLMKIPATYGYVLDKSPTRVGTPTEREKAKAEVKAAAAAKKAAAAAKKAASKAP